MAARRAAPISTKNSPRAERPADVARDALAEVRSRSRAFTDHPAAGGYGSRMERLGLRMGEVNAIARSLAKRLRDASPRDVLAVAGALVDSNGFDARMVAYDLVRRHRATMAAISAADLERLGRGLDNWASVDAFSCWLTGPAWRMGRIDDARLSRWTRSRDRWWRRCALASTVALNVKARGGEGDVPRTLAVCEALVADRDEMVTKALSWALRCAIAHDAGAVRAFVARHSDVLASLVRREVTNKLVTGHKFPRGGAAARSASRPRAARGARA